MKFIIVFTIASLIYCVSATPKERQIKKDDLSDIEHHEDDDDEHDAKYDHEAFLGKEEAEKFDQLSPEDSKAKLGQLFDKMDLDHDQKCSYEELSKWIKHQANRYIVEDRDKQWKEFNLDESASISFEEFKKKTLDKDGEADAENASRDQKRWAAADVNGDGKLNKDEFLDFLHPEDSPRMKDVIVQETLDQIDSNKDGKVSLDEYIKDMYTPEDNQETEPDWVKTEREQFQKERDTDGDGFLSAKEVAAWIMPEDYDHVASETKHLLHEADADKDGFLTKDEVLEKHDLFVGSQATDFGEALKHEEL